MTAHILRCAVVPRHCLFHLDHVVVPNASLTQRHSNKEADTVLGKIRSNAFYDIIHFQPLSLAAGLLVSVSCNERQTLSPPRRQAKKSPSTRSKLSTPSGHSLADRGLSEAFRGPSYTDPRQWSWRRAPRDRTAGRTKRMPDAHIWAEAKTRLAPVSSRSTAVKCQLALVFSLRQSRSRSARFLLALAPFHPRLVPLPPPPEPSPPAPSRLTPAYPPGTPVSSLLYLICSRLQPAPISFRMPALFPAPMLSLLL